MKILVFSQKNFTFDNVQPLLLKEHLTVIGVNRSISLLINLSYFKDNSCKPEVTSET